jgi:NADH:ubiquinone oxidoreductase subunit
MKISIFSTLSNIYMIFPILFKGRKVGKDRLGNIYYRANPRRGTKQERRWVIYEKKDEASLVPPEWHGWLHHQTDVVPDGTSKYHKGWIKPHQPNLTGTDRTYLPPPLKGGPRAASTGDYVPWQPPR